MSAQQRTIDRRTLLKLVGAAGAAATVVSAGRPPSAASSAAPASNLAQSDIELFQLFVSDDELEDLGRRLASPRWPADAPGEPWAAGTDRAYLQELASYWRNQYDWRRQETALNSFNHYTTTIEGQRIHFVHHAGRGASPLPLVMTHGWPGTFWEMLPAVRALSDPEANGGVAADAFDVVVPSIPGFGFSAEPAAGTDVVRTAELWVALMEKLGYPRFGAYGSDWGAGVTRALGARFPERLIGIHTAGTPRRVQRDPLTDEEREYVSSVNRWSVEESGYQRIQETKPQTLAFGLTDSPVGLAAWLTEKLRSWSDCGGDVESRFSKDQILTLVSIYWHTRTIGTSARYYYANGLVGSSGARRARPEVAAALMGTAPIRVPQGWAEFLGIPGRTRPPRSFVHELPANVTHWQVYDSGGHFPAFEEPEILVQDLRTFFKPLRSA